jgi:hypothetical protein
VLTDIKKYYEFIKHDKLLAILRTYVADQKVLDLVQQYIEAPWDRVKDEYKGTKRNIGIPQGPALSAFLANLYLMRIDELISSNSVDFVRYVDDLAILYEDNETAKIQFSLLELELKDNYGLSLSIEKTTVEPISVSNSEQLSSWLDDLRYDFVKSTDTITPITDDEKVELFEALNNVAGIIANDTSNLTKYLGFDIRYTEKINDKELLRGVYALAINILQENTPKHSATCIAIKSLIKACNDFKEDAWLELEQLLLVRTDEYFKILFCQEARRLVEENESFELYPLIVGCFV